ncbi:ornithine carbamoyltransferase [Dehalococcoidia bacterium]|nr:ornithine carbamoyltransferase [Dehalococcoidia bacterium]MCL0093503.1 ornithine carbamoyltransferase [Dehalococcoidia bacterium]
MKSKDLLSVADLSSDDLQRILDNALAMKRKGTEPLLAGQTLAMIFEKPSLRTRVSFDVAMYQLGGHAIYLAGGEVGLGQREPMKDVALVLSRYADLIMARTFAHRTVESLARCATVPVINGLSDREHPCQAISDLLTIYERKGKPKGLTLAYIGDGNNVAASLLLACALIGMHFKVASPRGYEIEDEIVGVARGIAIATGAQVVLAESPHVAVEGADVVYTDVWTSMGQENESEKRRRDFAGYQVTLELLAQAEPDAILMHPMPVHHGEEFAEGLMECPQSVLIDQAENRLHAQKAILVEMAINNR